MVLLSDFLAKKRKQVDGSAGGDSGEEEEDQEQEEDDKVRLVGAAARDIGSLLTGASSSHQPGGNAMPSPVETQKATWTPAKASIPRMPSEQSVTKSGDECTELASVSEEGTLDLMEFASEGASWE
eukprot:6473994-Amphidinium_carterae.1